MSDQMIPFADEHVNRIIQSYYGTQPKFLEHIIERLTLHNRRMKERSVAVAIDYDALPKVSVFAQANVSVAFASDWFYIIHNPVPSQAVMDQPKITTLRATPQEMLEYIEQGHAKTDDFFLNVVSGEGVIPVECVEIDIIDQNDTAFTNPLRVAKKPLLKTLQELVTTSQL